MKILLLLICVSIYLIIEPTSKSQVLLFFYSLENHSVGPNNLAKASWIQKTILYHKMSIRLRCNSQFLLPGGPNHCKQQSTNPSQHKNITYLNILLVYHEFWQELFSNTTQIQTESLQKACFKYFKSVHNKNNKK